MKSAIIVDSTAGLAPEYANHPDVYQVTLALNFANGDSFTDTIEAEPVKAFYQRLTEEAELPKTTQPSPGEYIEVLSEIVAKGYDEVFIIHLASAISGTLQAATMMVQDFTGQINSHIIDSKGTSVVMEHMVKCALSYIEAGLMPAEIVTKLNWLADNSHIYLMVDDLQALVKGGRASFTTALVGNMLKIIPVLEFKADGSIGMFGKIRTYKKVKKRWRELVAVAVAEYPAGITVAFAHADARDNADDMQAFIAAEFPDLEYHIAYLTPVLGTHGGKGCLGMAILPWAPGKPVGCNK